MLGSMISCLHICDLRRMPKKQASENTENLLFSAYIEVSMKKEYDR